MTDKRTIQIVIAFLGLIALTALAGVIYLLSVGRDPALAATFGTGALGALSGVLVSTRSQPDPAVGEALERVADNAWSAGSASTEAAVHQMAAGPPPIP